MAGNDWGAIIGWTLCLFRPDRVKGFISLSVPYMPRDPKLKPSEFFKTFGDGLYISQFQVKLRISFKIYRCFCYVTHCHLIQFFPRNLEELRLQLPNMIP